MLSESQQEFFDMIERSSCAQVITPFFDIEKRRLRLDIANESIGTLSHGEQIMLKFFIGVWFHKNDFGFDLYDAAGTLDEENREIIAEWLLHPVWP